MTLLAAYDVLLCFYSGQEDILVGSPIAGRTRRETEGLVGFFINTLVLRGNLAGDPTFAELLDRTRRMTREAYAHQDGPLQDLVTALDREPGAAALFRVWFVLENTPEASLDLPGLTLGSLRLDSGAVRHDLNLSLRETPEGLRGYLQYRADLIDGGTVAEMADLFVLLLGEAVRQPEIRLGELLQTLRTSAEERRAAAKKSLKSANLDKLHRIRRSPSANLRKEST